MNWVYNDLFGDTPYEMAPGHGVWELINTDPNTYSYTWYSQVKFPDSSDPSQFTIHLIRVYGTAQMKDCDYVDINYDFEIQIENENGGLVWFTFDDGIASETRLKVYTPDPQ